jgi:hypothetical protein
MAMTAIQPCAITFDLKKCRRFETGGLPPQSSDAQASQFEPNKSALQRVKSRSPEPPNAPLRLSKTPHLAHGTDFWACYLPAMTAIECYDFLLYAQELLKRLQGAHAELQKKQGLKDEKSWLEQSISRLEQLLTPTGELLKKCVALPELESARAEHSRMQQELAVEAMERLEAGITFHGGSRSPLRETLFDTLKFSQLVRVDAVEFEKKCIELEKKMNATYSKRMLGEPVFRPLEPTVLALAESISNWRNSLKAPDISSDDRQGLIDELDAAARKLELPIRQSKLLAEAACAPVKELFETSQIAFKPKKRNMKAVVTESVEPEERAADPMVAPPLEIEIKTVGKKKKAK